MEESEEQGQSPLTQQEAHELLSCFDTAEDETTNDFLADLLASGCVPREEVWKLYRLTGERAVEMGGDDDNSSSDNRRKQSPKKRRRKDKKKGKKKETRKAGASTVNAATSPFFQDDNQDDNQDDDMTVDTSAQLPCMIPRSSPLVAVVTTTTVWNSPFRQNQQICPDDQQSEKEDEDGEMDEKKKDFPVAPRTPLATSPSTGSSTTSSSSSSSPCSSSSASLLAPSAPQVSPFTHTTTTPSLTATATSSRRATTSHFFTTASQEARQKKREAAKRKAGSFWASSDGDDDSDDNKTPDTPTKARPPQSRTIRTEPTRSVKLALTHPFAPLAAARFGLVQEELAQDPFWLLVALVFLVRVNGRRVSLPVFWRIKDRYPTPAALAAADPAALLAATGHLGMATIRCATIQRYARAWQKQPPTAGLCTPVRNYPRPPEVSSEEAATTLSTALSLSTSVSAAATAAAAAATTSAWEIGHLTQGAYFIDSWRIFCRDVLLGRATDWQGHGHCCGSTEKPEQDEIEKEKGGKEKGDKMEEEKKKDCGCCGCGSFQPEWMRVLPRDKELRACLRWMWMKEGWDWNPLTGERTVLSNDLRRAVDACHVGYDSRGILHVLE